MTTQVEAKALDAGYLFELESTILESKNGFSLSEKRYYKRNA